MIQIYNSERKSYKIMIMLSLTNFIAGFEGSAPQRSTGPMLLSGTLSGERPRVSLAASSNSFCIFAFFFLKQVIIS